MIKPTTKWISIESYPKSTKITATLGICEGYNNIKEEVSDFPTWLQNKLAEIEKETRFYISFVVYETKVVYKKEWGCPDGGEKTYNIEAVRNPKFNPNEDFWIEEALSIIKILKKELKQSTVTVCIDRNCNIVYLEDDEEMEG